jgi:hypothetical protein
MADQKFINTTSSRRTKMQQPNSVENIRSAIHGSAPQDLFDRTEPPFAFLGEQGLCNRTSGTLH